MESDGVVSKVEDQNRAKPPAQLAADVAVGDQVRMRKPHPCGSFDWRIVRVGADIGMRCLGCDHRVNLTRPVFERRFKSFLARASADNTNMPA